jgi:hypothetical protein
MELKLDLYTESERGNKLGIIHVTFTEGDLEEAMQRWIKDRYTDTVLTSVVVDSIKP